MYVESSREHHDMFNFTSYRGYFAVFASFAGAEYLYLLALQFQLSNVLIKRRKTNDANC